MSARYTGSDAADRDRLGFIHAFDNAYSRFGWEDLHIRVPRNEGDQGTVSCTAARAEDTLEHAP